MNLGKFKSGVRASLRLMASWPLSKSANKGLYDVTIFLPSGYTQPQAKDVALAAGASDYLAKPIDFDELKMALEKYLVSTTPSHKKW